jgi:hypothetical protein
MKLTHSLLFLITAATASAQIQGPIIINNPSEIILQNKINASAFAEQWVYAFAQLKVTPSINIEIVTSKDGDDHTLSNIYSLTKSKNVTTGEGSTYANLLIAVQRINKHDYVIILDPRQIRYIRQVKRQ